jgi:hypothetical protein
MEASNESEREKRERKKKKEEGRREGERAYQPMPSFSFHRCRTHSSADVILWLYFSLSF